MAYYNDGPNMDADEPAPDLILQCGFCAAHIAYYGDATDARDTFTLGAFEQAVCECGAIYGEDDTLDVVREDDAPTASDTHAELAALRDEVARLRAAMEDIHRLVMASYTPADATELHEAILPTLHAALKGGGQ